MTHDPIGVAGGDLNLHRYVNNNPLRWNDPWGLWAKIMWVSPGNPRGHLAININDTYYEVASDEDAPWYKPLAAKGYKLTKQEYYKKYYDQGRKIFDTVVLIPNEHAVVNYLEKYSGKEYDYSILLNSCVTYVLNALWAGGRNDLFTSSVNPASVYNYFYRREAAGGLEYLLYEEYNRPYPYSENECN